MLNVTEDEVKGLLYLPFNTGALTVFTIGISGEIALDAAFPLRKLHITAASRVADIVKTVAPAQPVMLLRASASPH
jgi:hypothetical protein